MTLQEQLDIAQNALLLMFGLLLILSGYVLTLPPVEWHPKLKPPEMCKLHQCPLTECLGQHGE